MVVKCASESGVKPGTCEVCGYNISTGVFPTYTWGSRIRDHKVTSINDFVFVCIKCKDEYVGEKRKELFDKYRPQA